MGVGVLLVRAICGQCEYRGEVMAKWLYNSRGNRIAFINEDRVFSRSGRFIGRLDGDEVWHGSYKGEIVKDNRFLYNTRKG